MTQSFTPRNNSASLSYAYHYKKESIDCVKNWNAWRPIWSSCSAAETLSLSSSRSSRTRSIASSCFTLLPKDIHTEFCHHLHSCSDKWLQELSSGPSSILFSLLFIYFFIRETIVFPLPSGAAARMVSHVHRSTAKNQLRIFGVVAGGWGRGVVEEGCEWGVGVEGEKNVNNFRIQPSWKPRKFGTIKCELFATSSLSIASQVFCIASLSIFFNVL